MKIVKLAGLFVLTATLFSGTSFATELSCLGSLFGDLARISYSHTSSDTYSVKLKLNDDTFVGHGYLTEGKDRLIIDSLHLGKGDDILLLHVNVSKNSLVGTAELKTQSTSESQISTEKIVCIPTGN